MNTDFKVSGGFLALSLAVAAYLPTHASPPPPAGAPECKCDADTTLYENTCATSSTITFTSGPEVTVTSHGVCSVSIEPCTGSTSDCEWLVEATFTSSLLDCNESGCIFKTYVEGNVSGAGSPCPSGSPTVATATVDGSCNQSREVLLSVEKVCAEGATEVDNCLFKLRCKKCSTDPALPNY